MFVESAVAERIKLFGAGAAQRRGAHEIRESSKAATLGGFFKGQFFELAQPNVDLLVAAFVRRR